jgi:hypothetical protein
MATTTSILPDQQRPRALRINANFSSNQNINNDREANLIVNRSTAAAQCSVVSGKLINFDSSASERVLAQGYVYSSNCIEPVDSKEWLSKHGLKANKLTYESILNSIGFRTTNSNLICSIIILCIYKFYNNNNNDNNNNSNS